MNRNPVIFNSLHYGTICGLVVFALYLLIYFTGYSAFGPLSFITALVPVFFLRSAIRHVRNEHGEGYITFGKAFSTGLYTSFFYALLFGMSFYLMAVFIAPGLLNEYKKIAEESIEQSAWLFSETMMEVARENNDRLGMTDLVYGEAFRKFIWAVLLSLIFALAMKRALPKSKTENQDDGISKG
jgi:hypothetical protein